MLEEKTVTGMADMMNFPKRWEDFLHDYEFKDARRIYTNGSRLIPSFRVKQMMEHYAPVRHGRWEDRIDEWFGTSVLLSRPEFVPDKNYGGNFYE